MLFTYKRKKADIDVDDILLDAMNLSGLDSSQMEGRLSPQIANYPLYTIAFLFFLVLAVFLYRSFDLQIANHEKYKHLSMNNIIKKEIIFARRGEIKDRFGRVLASNEQFSERTDFLKRKYTNMPGFAHILGFVKYPKKDSSGNYWRETYLGVSGVEKTFNDYLNGKNGYRLKSVDALGNVLSDNRVLEPKDGKDLHLSIDAKLNSKLYELLASYLNKSHFKAGAAAIADIETGEVLALVSYPEFDLNKFADNDKKYIAEIMRDKNKPLLARAYQGEYAPGSIVKPFVAISALKENIISPEKKIISTGALRLENPYKPGTFFVFKDWKVHGPVNMKEAIAVSSDEYFYQIGGSYKSQKGLGIEKIDKYARLFGFGERTGIELPAEAKGNIPTPEWKKRVFGENWTIGNTYHTAIGQYGFLVTVTQALRYAVSLANYGKLYKLTIVKGKKQPFLKLPFSKEQFNVIHDGMRMVTTVGTGKALNIKGIEIASKTGTAEVGAKKEFKNSWVIGFWPYKNPKFAFAAVLEKGKAGVHESALTVMRGFFLWLIKNYPDYASGKYPSVDKKIN